MLTSPRSSTASQLFAYSAVVECGGRWWYELDGDPPEETPPQARRPIWSESPHKLPGGGEVWVRNSGLALEARVAGPTPEAELKPASEMTEAKILESLAKGADDASSPQP